MLEWQRRSQLRDAKTVSAIARWRLPGSFV